MLSATAARVADATRFGRPLAIGSARHEGLLRASLPNADILLEPVGRNSAPPIAAASLMSAPDDLILILSADHHIADVPAFIQAIDAGVASAEAGSIVTFGIQPDHPATGYGYIEAQGDGPVRKVAQFVEKPDLETAKRYVETGRFFWNAGIFLFKAQTMIDALSIHASDILEGVQASLSDGRLDRAAFSKVRSESIDFAVLEHVDDIAVVPVAMGWSDLGDFRSLHAVHPTDEVNVVTKGHVSVSDSANLYVRSEGPRIAVHGLEDVAIVATHGNVLVTRLTRAAEIKTVTAELSNAWKRCVTDEQAKWLDTWLWQSVMPTWAKVALHPDGGLVEAVDLEGRPILDKPRRGRVAPRQLFSFARAKRFGWNPDGAADTVIEAALEFLSGPGRSPRLGWAHNFNADGVVTGDKRDLYDHGFIALAGSELAALGDNRGLALADEAFSVIDAVFKDDVYGGWLDPETEPGKKLANPHMHLLEASLAHFEVAHDPASLKRIETIATLFERWMFDPETGAVIENFNPDWSWPEKKKIEPGHCYEWAFLLHEVERLTGRDMASWCRRLIGFAEQAGRNGDLALDRVDQSPASYRLWPQLERLRALAHIPVPGVDLPEFFEVIMDYYLKPGPDMGWIDRLNADRQIDVKEVPASMVYHMMTALAPIVPRR